MAEALRTPAPLPVRAVLFDLDGTLVDSAVDLAVALNRVREAHHLAAVPVASLRAHASHGARGMLDAGMSIKRDDPRFPALRDAFLAHYEAALCVHTHVFGGVPELLTEIGRRQIPWGIVTNKAKRFTLPLLDALSIDPPPAVVVCGDTTPFSKPHPAPLLFAAQTLGVPATECMYVGDAERDIAAGIAAGMKTVVAAYGYIDVAETPSAWAADGWIEKPLDLVPWLPGPTAISLDVG